MAEGAAPPERDDELRRTAWAKINLTLHVTGRRADGYHDLDSLVVFAGVGDTLAFAPDVRLSLDIEGPFAQALEGAGGNLVLRAAHALQERFGITRGAHIRLTKRLPVAAGVGGGSADAAATLQGLARLWDVPVGLGELSAIGGGIGADVPVCLAGRPSLLRGRGDEVLAAPSLPPAWLVLANPGVGLSTAAVFGRLASYGPGAPPPPLLPDAAALARYLARARNDLEPAARELVPEIAPLLAHLTASDGCLIARMSGSGATCFGLYAASAKAQAAAAHLARAWPAAWVRAVPMRTGDDEPAAAC